MDTANDAACMATTRALAVPAWNPCECDRLRHGSRGPFGSDVQGGYEPALLNQIDSRTSVSIWLLAMLGLAKKGTDKCGTARPRHTPRSKGVGGLSRQEAR